MNKTSPMVLALLFSGASALRSRQERPSSADMGTDGTTFNDPTVATNDHFDEDEEDRQDLSNFHQQIVDEANELMGKHDLPSNFQDVPFKVMADDMFSMYVNGQEVYHGDDWLHTYEFEAIVNKGVDTIAFELQDKRWGGNLIASFGDQVTDENWVCRDVPEDGGLPEGWNMNWYDDQSWAPAQVYGRNNLDETPWPRQRYTNPLFPEHAAFIWNQDSRATHILCRYNQLPFEQRAEHNGMCQDEMEAFEAIANKLIAHHQHRQEIWHARRRDLKAQIVQLKNLNHGLSETIEFMHQQGEEYKKMHEDEMERLNNEIRELHEHYEGLLSQLEQDMNQECSNKLHDAREKLNGEWNQVLSDAEEAHRNAMDEAAEAHRNAMEDAKQAHQEHLETTVEDMNNLHEDILDKTVNELKRQHEEHVDNTIQGLNEQFDNDMLEMENNLKDAHQVDLANKLEALRQELVSAYERQIRELQEDHEQLLSNTIEDYSKQLKNQSEVMGAEIDRLTRKHDYLYESCTTVQVVDGELVIN